MHLIACYCTYLHLFPCDWALLYLMHLIACCCTYLRLFPCDYTLLRFIMLNASYCVLLRLFPCDYALLCLMHFLLRCIALDCIYLHMIVLCCIMYNHMNLWLCIYSWYTWTIMMHECLSTTQYIPLAIQYLNDHMPHSPVHWT